MTVVSKPLADLTERDWQKQVVDLAKVLGYRLIYHTHDSRRSAHGFPDLVCVRSSPAGVVYLELKSATGKLSEPQKKWLLALLAANQLAWVARPTDWDVLGRALASSAHFTAREFLRERTRLECGL